MFSDWFFWRTDWREWSLCTPSEALLQSDPFLEILVVAEYDEECHWTRCPSTNRIWIRINAAMILQSVMIKTMLSIIQLNDGSLEAP